MDFSKFEKFNNHHTDLYGKLSNVFTRRVIKQDSISRLNDDLVELFEYFEEEFSRVKDVFENDEDDDVVVFL